jgi:DNA modification methylase
MTKPWYDFYRGDFNKLTADHIPDDSVHMIFTDPPYGGQYLDLWCGLSKLAARVLVDGGLLVSYSGQYHLPTVIEELGGHLKFVWMDSLHTPKGNALMRPVRVKSRWKPMLIFVKGKYEVMCTPECKQDCRTDTGKTRKVKGREKPVRETNFAECRHPCRRLHDTRWWRFDTLTSEPPDKSQHPEGWTQSQAEAEHYIELFTLPGDVVLDPMVGTGTTMVAALKLSRNAIGVDIDKKLIDKVAEPRMRELYG